MSMMIHRAVLRMRAKERAKEVKPMPSPAVKEPPKEEKAVKETAKQQSRKRKAE